MPTTTELLKNVSIFKDLDEGEIARVAEICQHEMYESGKYVFREGENGNRFYDASRLRARAGLQGAVGSRPAPLGSPAADE